MNKTTIPFALIPRFQQMFPHIEIKKERGGLFVDCLVFFVEMSWKDFFDWRKYNESHDKRTLSQFCEYNRRQMQEK